LKAGGLPESPTGTVAIPEWLAFEIAAMIEGESWCFYHFGKLKAHKKKGWSRSISDFDTRMKIGVFMERELKASGRGAYAGVVLDAQNKFNVSERTAATCLRFVKDYLEGHKEGQGALYSEEQTWQLLVERYCKDD
jgi:hypothetical protein